MARGKVFKTVGKALFKKARRLPQRPTANKKPSRP